MKPVAISTISTDRLEIPRLTAVSLPLLSEDRSGSREFPGRLADCWLGVCDGAFWSMLVPVSAGQKPRVPWAVSNPSKLSGTGLGVFSSKLPTA